MRPSGIDGPGSGRSLRMGGAQRSPAHRWSRVPLAAIAAIAAIGLFHVSLSWWTSFEAASAGWAASVLGSADASRAGHQLLVRGDAGMFVLTVSSWCSSSAPVLALIAAAAVSPGDRRRRIRAAVLASGLLVVGNVARITAVVLVGADIDPAQLEPFHDGPATAFTVVLVLSATAVVAWSTLPAGGRYRRQPAQL